MWYPLSHRHAERDRVATRLISARRIVVVRPHLPGPVTLSDVTVTRNGATTRAPMPPTTRAAKVMLNQCDQLTATTPEAFAISGARMARTKAASWLRMSVSPKIRQRDDSNEHSGGAGSGARIFMGRLTSIRPQAR